MYYGLDISKWQSSYNAETAKVQGVNSVILRAAYATSKDLKFDEFYAAAKTAGQTVGAYGFATWHYSSKNGGNIDTARAAMIEQTKAWIAICQDKLDGYFAIDQELESGYSMGLTPSQNETLLNECIALLEVSGFTVCVYCSASWAMTQFNKDNVNADLWIAYYYADPADPDFSTAANYETANGQYFDYMRSCGDKLMGWQFGRIGYGAKYGVGSVNVDRNLFYKIAETVVEYFSQGAVRVICGVMTAGDIATISAVLESLLIPYTNEKGYLITDIPITKGDQTALIKACAALQVGCAEYTLPQTDTDAESETAPTPEEEDVNPNAAQYLSIGFATPGDIATFEGLLTELLIPFQTEKGYITTLVAVTKGDIDTIEALCDALIVPCVYITPTGM
ncbi:MAG: GH25 family lysozyme [Faecalibacterium sp.]